MVKALLEQAQATSRKSSKQAKRMKEADDEALH
jgi:hypothetical protein